MWLLLPILCYALIFLSVRHIYSYWSRKGFPSERVTLTWAFLYQAYRREFRHVEAICEAYQAGRERLFGIYCFFRPVLLVRNVELARLILEQSNGHFSECKWDYVKGYRRFNLLEKLSPMFGSQRLMEMFAHAARVADQMVSHLMQQAEPQKGVLELDMQQVLRVYATNIVGSLIYGLDVNNFEQQDGVFSSYAGHAARRGSLQSFTLSRLPKKSSLTYRLRDIIRCSVEHREDHGIIRKDVLQLLVKFRNGNDLCDGKWQVNNAYEIDKCLSITQLAKVAEELLKMSLDTIAATTTLTLYEVLQQPQLLEKLQAELKQLSTELQYEHLNDLKYMNMCLKETLRKYPPIPIIERICRKSYKLPNSRHTIGEGKTLMVPILAIQRDEKHFSEPMQYKPLRFLHEQLNGGEQCVGAGGAGGGKTNSAFMGYGIGGAQCVAQNFAKMVIKIALIKLLQNFQLELEPSQANDVQVAYQPAPFIKSKEGLRVRLKTREIKTQFYL